MRISRNGLVVLTAAVASCAAYAISSLRVFEPLFAQREYQTIDYRIRMSPTRPQSDIALVFIDSAAVANFEYLSPTPRAPLAKLITGIAASRPTAIGVDLFFGDRYPRLNALDSGELKLRNAIEHAGNVVLIGATERTFGTRRWQTPHPYFADVAAAIGTSALHTPFETIRDGVLTIQTKSGLIPSFALAIYAQARGLRLDSLMAETERTGRLSLPGLPKQYAALTDEGVQTFPILFAGPPSRPGRQDGAFTAYSAAALLSAIESNRPLPSFRNQIVLVGSGYHDSERFRSPFYDVQLADGTSGGWTYGVEVHANAVQSLLSGTFPIRVSDVWVVLLILVSAGAVASVTLYHSVIWGSGAAGILLAANATLAIVVFQRGTLMLPIVGPALAVLTSLLYARIARRRAARIPVTETPTQVVAVEPWVHGALAAREPAVLRRGVNAFRALKQRRIAVLYMVTAWVGIQVAETIVSILELPAWSAKLVLAVAVIGFPIALIFAWNLELEPESTLRQRSHEPSATGGISRPPTRSVAVLPFQVIGSGEDDSFFADGLTDDVIAEVSRSDSLKVISRTSVMRFKHSEASVPEIAAALGVDAVLEGSVRRVGERLRVVVQLIDARTDEHLWAETYDRTVDDILAIQTEIAVHVRDAMRVSLMSAGE